MAEYDKPAPETQKPAGESAATPPKGSPETTTRPEATANGPVLLYPVLMELAERRERLNEASPELGRDIARLLRDGSDPSSHKSPEFRRDAANVVQDAEKALHERLPLAAETRKELSALAGTAPGVTNERVLALLQSTERIADDRLVRGIRDFAADVGTQPKQDTVTILGATENFENKVRLAARAEPIADTPKPADAITNAQSTNAAQARAQTAPVEKPTDSQRPSQDRQQPTPAVVQRNLMDTLFDGIRSGLRGVTEPTPGFDPPHTPMKDRIAAFEARIQTEKEDKLLARTEASGRATLEALQGLQNSAASVLIRINEAARNNPGGLEGVLSEMRPGGQFADLRTQFNASLNTDQGVAAAYDKAAASLARYGEQRPALDAVLAKRSDATNLAAKFDRLDAEIGEAAGGIPSRRDGKSMIEDLTKQVAEILSKAVDGVRAIFSRTASASPGPSPGMSP